MPYIDSTKRAEIDDFIQSLSARLQSTTTPDNRAGVLNYTITTLLLSLYRAKNYRTYNEIIGILSCVQQEIYRREIGPYENGAIHRNGDLGVFLS